MVVYGLVDSNHPYRPGGSNLIPDNLIFESLEGAQRCADQSYGQLRWFIDKNHESYIGMEPEQGGMMKARIIPIEVQK